jgi:hypothetical protein
VALVWCAGLGKNGGRAFYPPRENDSVAGCVGCTPSPRGYFGSKIPGFNSLQVGGVCKIFKTNGLFAKYLLSMSWPRGCPGLALFLISISSIAVGGKLIRQLDPVSFVGFRWVGGLTCVFWAGNAEKKCERENNSRSPSGMTTRKIREKEKTKTKADPPPSAKDDN